MPHLISADQFESQGIWALLPNETVRLKMKNHPRLTHVKFSDTSLARQIDLMNDRRASTSRKINATGAQFGLQTAPETGDCQPSTPLKPGRCDRRMIGDRGTGSIRALTPI